MAVYYFYTIAANHIYEGTIAGPHYSVNHVRQLRLLNGHMHTKVMLF